MTFFPQHFLGLAGICDKLCRPGLNFFYLPALTSPQSPLPTSATPLGAPYHQAPSAERGEWGKVLMLGLRGGLRRTFLCLGAWCLVLGLWYLASDNICNLIITLSSSRFAFMPIMLDGSCAFGFFWGFEGFEETKKIFMVYAIFCPLRLQRTHIRRAYVSPPLASKNQRVGEWKEGWVIWKFYNCKFYSTIKPVGPHLSPKFLTVPLRVYMPNLNINLIGIENRNKTVIYQWVNLINGKFYVGSAWKGSSRLLSYWTPSVAERLKRNFPIYNSLNKYGHNNFCLAILEDLGSTGSVSKEFMLKREQYYLDILFSGAPLASRLNEGLRLAKGDESYLILNNSPTAGSTLGYKQSAEFKLNRSGKFNPMYGKNFSAEFLEMQGRSHWDKSGNKNPNFGKKNQWKL